MGMRENIKEKKGGRWLLPINNLWWEGVLVGFGLGNLAQTRESKRKENIVRKGEKCE